MYVKSFLNGNMSLLVTPSYTLLKSDMHSYTKDVKILGKVSLTYITEF